MHVHCYRSDEMAVMLDLAEEMLARLIGFEGEGVAGSL